MNNNKPYRLTSQEVLAFDFDIYLRSEQIKFGYIFRILSDKNQNFDLIVNNQEDKFLVINNQDFHLNSKFLVDQWNHVSISFDKKSDKISLRFNDEIKDSPCDLSATESLLVYFGLCDNKGFFTNDVPPFILKDVVVQYNEKKHHHWALGRHGKNIVYDELKMQPAIVHHPYWLMDNGIHWEKCAEFKTAAFPQITFDPKGNQIYCLIPNGYICYSLITNTTEEVLSSGDIPHNKYYNKFLFDPVSNRLLYYDFDATQNYFFDAKNKNWGGYKNKDGEEPTHAHHNRYISLLDSMLYLFGGYGFYQYKSDFFRVDLKTNERTLFDLSHTITPRYLAAMGGNKSGNKLYVFGGRGSEMGRQELSPKNFSDLYEIDLKTIKVKFLFDLDKQYDEDNVYSNSLIVDEKENCFYVLAYPNNKYLTSITLKKIDFSTHEVQTLADTIEFHFRDITSFCDLYYSPKLSKLIAVASYSDDKQNAVVNVYTLDYPPLKECDVIQEHKVSKLNVVVFTLATILVVMLITFFILLIISKKSHKEIHEESKEKLPQDITPSKIETILEKTFYDKRIHKDAILFLGGFQVFDKDGNNITGEFTPTLKFILVLIILYTLKNDKGISSTKLQELLWFDKLEEAARNNRSVNLRKLRVLLQAVGDIDINNENGYWKIIIPSNVFSDYWEVLRLLQKFQAGNIHLPDDMLKLLELLSFGPVLPNIQFEWIDSFKNDFSNSTIDVLLNFVNEPANPYSNNQDFRLKIADAILKIDPISEDAIAIKCNALFKMGKKGLAKTIFDNFNKEYKLLLGEDYRGSIKNFLE